jgi:amidase
MVRSCRVRSAGSQSKAASTATPSTSPSSPTKRPTNLPALEDALRAATAGLGQWLEQDYHLTPSEIAIVLGSSVEYTIAEVADRNAGVAAKLRKDRLVFK